MKTLKELDLDKVATAIEADAGQALAGLRDALERDEVKRSRFGIPTES